MSQNNQHYVNIFNEGTQAQNIGQGQDFPALGGGAPQAQQQQPVQQQPVQQQQPFQIDPQAAFQVFWSMMDENARAAYMQSTQEQQSASYGSWFNQYTIYMQQQYMQQQAAAAQQAQVQQQQQNQFQQQQQQFEPQQQQTSSSSFNTNMNSGASEFVPTGHFRQTEEQFPDMDAAFGAAPPKKGGKKEPAKKQDAQPTEEDLATPYKGKPSAFFELEASGKPNAKQMAFVYEFYPEYGSEPDYTQFFKWLYDAAYAAEASERISVNAYRGPARGGRMQQPAYDEDSDDGDDTFVMSGFGTQAKGKKKQVLKKEQEKAAQKKSEAASKKTLKDGSTVDTTNIPVQKKTKTIKYVQVQADENEIVEVDESKEPVSLVFIGHVDAGKSTICGNLMLNMGVVDQQIIEKYKAEAKKLGRDSWWLAYVMDNSEEEKAKGKTVEMGRAFFDTNTKQYTVFDAPGHKNYVPNMIMGASLADFGGLVISARKNEFEAGFERDGQTREHVHLAKSLGIEQLIIVVNKMDDPSVNWGQSRYAEIMDAVLPFVYQTGFSKENVHCIPISGLTGDNIVEKVSPETCSWYKGKTLVEALDTMPLAPRDPTGPLRLPVLDKMTDQGTRMILGKIEQGTIKLGDKCIIAPVDNPCQIGKIYNSQDKQVRYARPGENVKLKLLHIENDAAVSKGDVLCHQDAVVPAAEILEADLELLELLTYKPVFTRGYSAIFHMHTLAEDCTIKDIMSAQEKDSSDQIVNKEKPKFIRSFAKAKVRIQFKQPIALEKFSVLAPLGQFTLRDEGKTIALGKVMRYKPAAGAAAKAAALAKKMGGMQVSGAAGTEKAQSKAGDIVFDMETGQVQKEKPAIATIAEEDEA